jgi:hypothetical protein
MADAANTRTALAETSYMMGQFFARLLSGARRRVACRLVTRFKLPRAQVRFDRRHDPAPTDDKVPLVVTAKRPGLISDDPAAALSQMWWHGRKS